ncbi:PKD domain-containing protein [candidate division KSB1 bacterium]
MCKKTLLFSFLLVIISSGLAFSQVRIAFETDRHGNREIYVMDPDGSNQTRLTFNTGSNEMMPAWSPDGSKIAFVTDRHGKREIYLMNADGTNQTRLTFNTGFHDQGPSWSPDGSKIAYYNYQYGRTEIFVMNADGSGSTRLNSGISGWNHDPEWSPDGSKIIFRSDYGGNSELWAVNADGSGKVNITSTGNYNEYHPSWSPVNNRIVYNANAGSSASSSTPHDIWVMNADGSGKTNLTNSSGYSEGSPDWSIAGDQISFHANRDGNVEIYAIGSDGSNPVNLTNNPGNDYNPDYGGQEVVQNEAIAFESNRDGNYEIYIMKPDGSNQIRLTFSNGSNTRYPDWSPDGSKIAYVNDQSGNWDIWTMNADGSNNTRLTFTSYHDIFPVWSPDGSKLLYFNYQYGHTDIFVMNADGSGITRLTGAVGIRGWNHDPEWSPDGSKIIFRSDYGGNSELWVMNADGSDQINITNTRDKGEYHPSWSPVNNRIVYNANLNTGNHDLYVMNADGSGKTNLTNSSGWTDGGPDWSGAGDQISFYSNMDGNYEIYAMDANGSNIRRLTNTPANDLNPSYGGTFPETPNSPPVADAGPNQTIAHTGVLTDVQLDGSGSYDPDGDPLTYDWSGPFGTASGVRPTVKLPVGVHEFSLNVHDGTQNSVDQPTVTITITNTVPVANAGDDQTLPHTGEFTQVQLDGSASVDAEGDTLQYTWSGPFGTVSGVNPVVLLPTGANTITLVVNDGFEDSAPDLVVINIINSAPAANAGEDVTISRTGELTEVQLDGSASSDPEGDPLTYTWTGPFGTTTGAAPAVQLPIGTHTITLIVNDGAEDSEPDNVIITITNTAPVANAGPDIILNRTGELTDVQLNGTLSSDSEGDPLTYTWTGPFGTATGVTPTVQIPLGSHIISLVVNDGAEDSEPDEVLVSVVNTAPIANAGTDQTLTHTGELTEIQLDGSLSSDSEGDPLTYTWTGTFGTAAGVNPVVKLPLGTHTITLVVNDGTEDSEPDEVKINVMNTLPVANAGEDQTIEGTGPVTEILLDGSASYDSDGDTLTYTWWGSFETVSGVNPAVQLPPGLHTITLIVNDGTENSVPDTLLYEVTDTTPPEIELSVTPENLWPANHKMVEVNATIEISDICDSLLTVELVSIASNEPANGKGDGNTDDDIQEAEFGTDDRCFQLRAERSGKGSGRIYTIEYSVTDFSGNSTSATVQVMVEHDKGKMKKESNPFESIPDNYELFQNYPNPFNPQTTIKFNLPSPELVSLEVYNIMGQRVKTLVSGQKSAGYYSIVWDGTNNNGFKVGTGVYIYYLKAGKFTAVKRMLLIK